MRRIDCVKPNNRLIGWMGVCVLSAGFGAMLAAVAHADCFTRCCEASCFKNNSPNGGCLAYQQPYCMVARTNAGPANATQCEDVTGVMNQPFLVNLANCTGQCPDNVDVHVTVATCQPGQMATPVQQTRCKAS